MKAVIIERFGGPDQLKVSQCADPRPGRGAVLLRVKACALNHLDIWVRDGIPSYKIKLPHILGCDVAGVVEALGPEVVGAKVGDRYSVSPGRSCRTCDFCLSGQDHHCQNFGIIGAQGGPGGYAEFLSVPEEYLLPLPAAMTFEEGAAYPLTFLTAWNMLMTLGGCGPDQWVLCVGAGSGVAAAAIPMAKLTGAKVIATSTSQAKLDKARELGADAVILTPGQNMVKEVAGITGGRMCDLVIEHVGPAVFMDALKSLRSGGRLVTCGATSGHELALDLRYVFSRQLQILGSKMGSQADMRRAARLVTEGKLKPIIDRIFPLEEARAAHEYLKAQKQFGKIVLSLS